MNFSLHNHDNLIRAVCDRASVCAPMKQSSNTVLPSRALLMAEHAAPS